MPAAFERVYDAWRAAHAAIALAVIESSRPEAQEINNAAYFLLLFSQLERELDAYYLDCVGDLGGLPFLSRLQFLLGSELPGSLIERVFDDYELRCAIAHGRIHRANIQLSEIAEDYLAILNAVRSG